MERLPRNGSALFELFTDILSSLLSLVSTHWCKIVWESIYKGVVQKDSTMKSRVLLDNLFWGAWRVYIRINWTFAKTGLQNLMQWKHAQILCGNLYSATVASLLQWINVSYSGTISRLMYRDFSLCREMSLLFKQGYHCTDRWGRAPLTYGFS